MFYSQCHLIFLFRFLLWILFSYRLEGVLHAILFSSVQFSCSVVSDSLRRHGLQSTRLLRPWDFPGKSTGVGWHCLFLILSSWWQDGCLKSSFTCLHNNTLWPGRNSLSQFLWKKKKSFPEATMHKSSNVSLARIMSQGPV